MKTEVLAKTVDIVVTGLVVSPGDDKKSLLLLRTGVDDKIKVVVSSTS